MLSSKQVPNIPFNFCQGNDFVSKFPASYLAKSQFANFKALNIGFRAFSNSRSDSVSLKSKSTISTNLLKINSIQTRKYVPPCFPLPCSACLLDPPPLKSLNYLSLFLSFFLSFSSSVAIERKAYPSPLNYHNFPKSCCTSVNEIICHGIPDSTVLKVIYCIFPTHRYMIHSSLLFLFE